MGLFDKGQIEAEFNAGVTYAESVALLLREAANGVIAMKYSLNPADMIRVMATLQELWCFVRPYRIHIKEMLELKEELNKLEKEALFLTKTKKKDLYEKFKEIDIVKQELINHTVMSGLIPYKKKLTEEQKLKIGLLE